ncbi:hypothetical protein [Burkholderia cenocepacia]|jgi:predicted membrane-bound mannosyltransferase|uniref:Phage transmembrane protein n=1 Tax=Burkholderia cenocepacia (strain ATCC BAA-245 / DSM 16553 / LMG 16656 / NCTC 13227 / J2315 / CF5610) TaxID=216591 RepID=B4EG72_BURCJ|nr:hypothetical protein [Burkholderia cenocepacia]KIS49647.1 hypothetical protein NP88_2222 [Burkholderia cepacia]EPZ90410.1 hypothetical protein BURCENK562V_C3122 [Burkholderia cenocepacia K56-2Valvano]ERI31519.1 hypothetical protein BURCENBC7_AP3206 [Burkholderia cenocepacia BC7]KKI81573.1 membrane protein [Burkholderia cenocepacia]KKI81758.1 membrane protein [Burkholderia cenocepacia]
MTDHVSAPARVEERLRAGDRRFSKLEQRIDESDAAVKAHLQRQDEKLDAVVASVSKIQTNTQSMVDTWEGGARAVRALCRLADAWRFLVRHVAGPTIAFGTVGVIVFRYMRHEPIPDWASAVVKLLLG